MKTMHQVIVASLFAALGGGAIAQEATPDTWMKAGASMSREQVKSELVQARKDGTIKAVTPGYDFVRPVAATKTRDQVRAEVATARASGEFDALNAEAHAFQSAPRTPVYAKAK